MRENTAVLWPTLALSVALLGASPARAEAPVRPEALDRLVRAAELAHSDALVVWKDGKLYREWDFGRERSPIEAMSATKSVVNLAFGLLFTQGKIKSLDQPVYDFYPEWKQGKKKGITLRHLLNHTSGLQDFPRTDLEIYPSPDFVKLALAAELAHDPGTFFFYSNKAVNLLSGIVQVASGKRLDLYLKDELFAPLGIRDSAWTLDQAGNPHAMAGLQILPGDLARIGQLVLDRGRWAGRQLIRADWFDLSLRPGQPFEPTCGLLWWLTPETRTTIVDEEQIRKMGEKGVPADFLAKARKAMGRYDDRVPYMEAVAKAFGPDWQDSVTSTLAPLGLKLSRSEVGKTVGFSAQGYLGQWLVILPEANLVVVRMKRYTEDFDDKTDNLMNLERLALDLVR